MRLGGSVERIEAYQIVASGARSEDCLVVGSHHEVLGFISGVEKEIEALRQAVRQ